MWMSGLRSRLRTAFTKVIGMTTDPDDKLFEDDIEAEDDIKDGVTVDLDKEDGTDDPPATIPKTSVPVTKKRDREPKPLVDSKASDRAIAGLKARIAAEQTARAEAQRQTLDARYDAIRTAEESEKVRIAALRAKKLEAKRAGEYEAEDEIDDQIMDAKISLDKLRNGRVQIESIRGAPADDDDERPAPTRRQERQPTEDELIEERLSQMAPRTADWLREHPEYLTDQKKQHRASAAHFKAVSEDLQPDTDEYFEFIETELGMRASDDDDGYTPSSADDVTNDDARDRIPLPPSKRPARQTVAAPVSRGGSRPGGDAGQVINLDADERRAARDFGMTEREYAKFKQQEMKRGAYAKYGL